jgi:hypothetical protein
MLLPEGEKQRRGIRTVLQTLVKTLESKLALALPEGDDTMQVIPGFLFSSFEFARIKLAEF